jgi:hypothetical protein
MDWNFGDHYIFKQYKYKTNNLDNMSLEYYLICKKEHENIIYNIQEIINSYKLILDVTKNEKNIINSDKNLIEKIFKNQIFFNEKLKELNHSKFALENNIINKCEHEYIDDYIDITPEMSKKITYCRICEYTKS